MTLLLAGAQLEMADIGVLVKVPSLIQPLICVLERAVVRGVHTYCGVFSPAAMALL